jgi:virginiamycin A acetyltransferase
MESIGSVGARSVRSLRDDDRTVALFGGQPMTPQFTGSVKSVLKLLVGTAAMVAIVPILVGYWLSFRILGKSHSFSGLSQAMSLFPGLSGQYLRRAFYQSVLRRCEKGSVVSFGTVFSHPTVQIGTNAYIGVFCCIGDVSIEDDVLIGSHVSISNGNRQHGIDRLDIPVREQLGVWPRVTIGRDSWIGDRAIVMADVGKHCVVGAGAVVTKPVPDYAIVVGSPARIIGCRKSSLRSYKNHIPNGQPEVVSP